ncbi:MAG: L-2-hydroxyglutarate oxidase [bacterium]
MQTECNVLIVGAGIIGLTIARELLRKGVEDIVIIEKEKQIGCHASGRNSGVLHAGIYYTPDSLKARLCLEGNRLMKQFCREKGLTLKETGKVIVAKNYNEIEGLYELKRRADVNGARSSLVDVRELSEIEPYAITYEKALYSPETAVIMPLEILHALEEELITSKKVKIFYSTAFVSSIKDHVVRTSSGFIRFKTFINAAGAYADRIAHEFGVAGHYKIIPFKGTYKRLSKKKNALVKGNIYPVPDLRNPFLGVHFTRSADDTVYIGPTAIPNFGRENYKIFDGLGIETLFILYNDFVLLLKDPVFRYSAIEEFKKYRKQFVFKEARKLVKGLEPDDIESTDKIGIRAQLINTDTNKLEMDFVLIKDGDALHILNAVSPAFTSSMAFAKYALTQFLG